MLVRDAVALSGNPNRFMGQAIPIVGGRSAWGNNGDIRNIWAGPATVIAGNSIADTAAYPNGYEPPGSWVMAPKGGGLSCYNKIESEGDLSIASLSMGRALAAALSGSGTISAATLSLIIQLAAAITGVGTLGTPTMQAVAGLAAALTGSGTISAANLSLIVSMIAALTGAGSVTVTLRGTGSLEADIVVSGGDVLTASSVASAVWASTAEGSYTYAQVMRILAAVAAGKTTIEDLGGGASTMKFRDLSDTLDRVDAELDENDRVNVDLDVS